MLSQPRLKEILQLLLQPPVHSAADLAQRFDVTVRTIRSDIQALNRLMQGASINLKRGKGYELEIRDQATFEDWKHQALSPDWTLSLDSMEDRQRYLLSILLMHPEWQDPDDLADMIYVSRNTIQSYLRSIRNLVSRYELVFESRGQQGVRISGPEEKRRQCLSEEVLDRNLTDYVTGFSPLEKRLFEHTDLSALSGILYSCLQESCLTCSDYALKNLVLHTAMMLERIRAGGVLPSHETETLPAEVETAAQTLCRTLEQKEHISICPAEQNSLALHIALNTRFSGISEREDLRTAITRMLDRIAAVWHFDLRNDPVLQKDLYNHLFSIFKARRSEQHHLNPLLNTIRSSFPLAYDISLDAVNHVFQTVRLSEDEIGYISLHIGAAVERCYSGQMIPAKVFLVCGSGMATSRMLEARLKSYFQSKLEILGSLSYQQYLALSETELTSADFFITTVPLPDRGIPFVEVEFSLTRDNAENVARMLSPAQAQFQGPCHFFQEDLFVRFDTPVTKEQVLDELCTRLIQAGISEPGLRESVEQREAISHTNLNDIFAIPHPMAPEAARTRAAVAILDHPVPWNDSGTTVQIVFLLAFCKGEQKSIERLYDFLLEIVQSVSLQQSILKAETFEEFRQLCLRP
ncbi:BglG family transcription antiterminator [Faecalibaculum rodentium]|uniref:BglG family transcription antiterminator n=1 Tax=Faecalibaculum rodentium TaxID=1702221 RepID=UPI0023F25136|nr:BglG family transcription antiterminator [Faecalibaculum rodentium]